MNKIKNQTFEQGMEAFSTALKALWLEYYTKQGMLRQMPTLVLEPGQKFIRVVSVGYGGSRTVWGFIEIASGDIYKAAGWNGRAKHVRGSIHNEDPMYNCGAYSPNYIK